MSKAEIILVKKLGEQIGFGQLMWLSSALWRISLKEHNTPENGAFVPTGLHEFNDTGLEIALNSIIEFQKTVESILTK